MDGRGRSGPRQLPLSRAQHPKSAVGLFAIDRDRTAVDAAIADLTRHDRRFEAALVTAGADAAESRVDRAMATLDELLTSAPAGPAGWIIPIDPMLAAIRNHSGKPALLAKLAARAA